jgi:hypothetical protein
MRKSFTASLWRKGFSHFFEKILYAVFSSSVFGVAGFFSLLADFFMSIYLKIIIGSKE